jgi:hypothetical protein
MRHDGKRTDAKATPGKLGVQPKQNEQESNANESETDTLADQVAPLCN